MAELARSSRSASALGWAVVALYLMNQGAAAQNCTAPGCTVAEINAWPTEVIELIRGPVNIDQPELGSVNHGDPAKILLAASGVSTEAVSLGDGGSVIVKFEDPIYDGPDYDFAVFENGISSGDPAFIFMELGFVEVSSDDIHYARFPSLTSRTTIVATFEEANPDDYDNLAGNRVAGTGTEFDLSELDSHPLVQSGDVDLDAILYVRIEDVVGNGSRSDGLGNPIYDPFSTTFLTGGFDIDSVGAIHVPESGIGVGLITLALSMAWLRRRREDVPSISSRSPERTR
jgi:hypothetical protein